MMYHVGDVYLGLRITVQCTNFWFIPTPSITRLTKCQVALDLESTLVVGPSHRDLRLTLIPYGEKSPWCCQDLLPPHSLSSEWASPPGDGHLMESLRTAGGDAAARMNLAAARVTAPGHTPLAGLRWERSLVGRLLGVYGSCGKFLSNAYHAYFAHTVLL